MARQLTRRAMTGPLTLVPGIDRLALRIARPGSVAPLYVYGVWLRHLTAATRHDHPTRYRSVIEIGPGKSLGIGLCALLCGAESYDAWDVVSYRPTERSLAQLDELVRLFRARAAAPEGHFSEAMFDGRFPGEALSETDLEVWLDSERVESIRAALRQPGIAHGGIRIRYGATLEELDAPADLVLSQAVMEHVDDLSSAYAQMFRALRPGGLSSHQIDFKSHHFARAWNGHWTLTDRQWRLIRGGRTYAINLAPLHEHVEALEAAGFTDVTVDRITRESTFARSDLRPRFATMPEIDLVTSSALVQAVR
jgi:SAM-dependent methyltransferase